MGTELHYKLGSFYRVCDRTGFATRAGRTKMEWNGLIVRDDVWEIRQPQDYVTGVPDIQTVPMARPRQVDAYDGPLHTSLTVQANNSDTLLFVVNAARQFAGDEIGVALDDGELLQTMILHVNLVANTLKIQTPIPSVASVGNDIVNYSAISPPNFGPS